MQRWLVMAFTLLLSNCAYNRHCAGLAIQPEVSVSSDGLDFTLVLPDDVRSVWIRYGTDIYHMGTVSVKSKNGKVSIRRLRQGTVYYWQIIQQKKCGSVWGRIYQNRTLSAANIPSR